MKFVKLTVSYESNLNKAAEQFLNVENVVRVKEGNESAMIFLSDSTNVYIPMNEVNLVTGIDEPSQMTIIDEDVLGEDTLKSKEEESIISKMFKKKIGK